MRDLKTLFSVIIIVLVYYLEYGEGRRILSIKDFITDTNHTNVDHSQAFQKAWKELCEGGEASSGSALVIQKNETYTSQPQFFQGPCVSSNIHIQIDGKIEAPAKPKDWENTESQSWLYFKDVEGLVLNGSGVLHPHGETWWPSVSLSKRPTTISFVSCTDIIYNGLTQMNSPKNHISIYGCNNATLSNLNISAPEDSPNTDGINICISHKIHIFDSSIKTGDDCVAITGGRGGSSDINITRVACGPGHGISIGSLGKDETNDIVQNVNVRSCSFSGTQNGARIKTWHGGQGMATNILYENITLIDARFPIIIDQHYSDGSYLKGNAVGVNNVTFRHFEGTCASEIAIKLDCEETENCHNIVMEHINITSSSPDKNLTAYCKFADVRSSFVNIDVNCNTYEDHQPRGLELLFSVILVASYHLQYGDGRMNLSIKNFISDANNTNADYSQAFKDAWKAICEANGKDEATSLVIHANETYIIQPQLFQGPCVSRNLHIQIDGKLEAPKMVKEWKKINNESKCWLCFANVTGLVLNGSGVLHPHGEAWWSSIEHSHRQRTVGFNGSSNIIYNGLTQMNSPKNHISILNCTNATLSNLHLITPGDSPNTDGIDIALSNNIQIFNSSIQTGDDCVAINGGSYDINITRVACGPGHGISIGSLGRGGVNDTVENVKVRHCSFNGTHNGARIKTWAGGHGFAKDILYENITLTDAKYPIIIDQHYCNGGHNCTEETTAVRVSNVTFKNFKGTCANDIAIKLDCDKVVGCHAIVMEHINITSSSTKMPLTAYCQFADIVSHFVSIDIKCGSDEPPAPTKPPTPAAQPPTLFP